MPDGLTSQSAFLQGHNARTTNIGAQAEYLPDTNYRRTTGIGAQAEYVPSTNYRRTTDIGANIEYVDTNNYRRTTLIGVQVEYKPLSVSSQDAYLTGVFTANHAQASYLSGADTALSDTSAFLQGQENALSDAPAYTEGVGPQALGSQKVFLSGEVNTFSSTQAFLSAASASPAISWAELETPQPPVLIRAPQDAYTHGQADASASQDAYLKGASGELSSQDAYTAGNQLDLDSQAAYLTGILQATSNIPAYTEGYSPSGPASSSQDAYSLGAMGASTSQAAFMQGGKGALPITLGSGSLYNAGSAILTTSRGEKYAVFRHASNSNLQIYKYIDGAPLRVADVDENTIGNNRLYYAAAIDGSDKLHVIVLGMYGDTRPVSYRVFSTASDAWEGSGWEQAAPLTSNNYSYWGVKIAIDSNGKPHAVYHDMVSARVQLFYIEKTGASWSTPLQLSATAADHYTLNSIAMKASDDIEVWYHNVTDNDSCYIVKTSGSWGAEQVYTGTFFSISTGLLHTSDHSGNMFRYAIRDAGTYATIYENNVDLSIQMNDSGAYASMTWLTSMGKVIIYRHEDTGIWAAVYIGGAWWTKRINPANVTGIVTEWAYNFENENTVAGFIYVVSNTVYYDEILPSVFSHQPAYLQGYEPKGVQPAYLRGSASASSSAHAYMFCGTQERSSLPAFTEGDAVQSSTSAYLEGSEFSSIASAYLLGGIGSGQPSYLFAHNSGTSRNPAYIWSTGTLESSQSGYALGNIASRSSQHAFCQTSVTSTTWRQTAFLQGIQVNHQHAYLEGLLVARPFVRVRNGEQIFTFKVLTEGYSDGELAPSIAAVRTISGGLDVSVGGKYRSWRPTLRCNYTDMTNLETLYASVEPWVYEDHFGMEHNVVAVGELRKSLIGSVIEGANSLFLVRVTFVEVI